ncbi:MAG: class I SAM-dependent methyltransferase [Eubacteriaceae bacterium]|jgi:trans-aconitate methyltransferase
MNTSWNTGKYGSSFNFVYRYGEALLELLDIRPGMTALDLGCGNGALTEMLAEQSLEVTGLDGSEEMLAAARRNHPDLNLIQGDAVGFELPEPVDIVFSNAVFHWIRRADQPAMIRSIARALKPGGQLVFEMGGAGNNVLIHSVLRQVFEENGLSYQMPFYFPSIGEYAPMLEQAGLNVEYAILFDRMTDLEGENGLEDWIRMFVRKPFADITPEDGSRVIHEAAEKLKPQLYFDGLWHSDYVRLRMKAKKVSPVSAS